MNRELRAEAPDLAFALATAPSPDGTVGPAAEPGDTQRRAADLIRRIAQEFAVVGPAGWQRFDALFTLTVGAEFVLAYFTDAEGNSVEIAAPAAAVELAHAHRELVARSAAGPWWRMLLHTQVSGEWEVEYDYGDQPFPADQIFEPAAYHEDLLAFPRSRLPVWLAAYIGHAGRQWRDPVRAASADHRAAVAANGLPDLPVLWARWATIAAAFVVAGSEWGPRIAPALGWFEGNSGAGSTLVLLPGGRAVLSGGTLDAPELDAAYNGGAELPDLYAGAPDWLADPVLNQRAASGLLSFCYWWDGAGWYHGGSPEIARIAQAMPGVWAAETVVEVVTDVLSVRSKTVREHDIAELLAAAEAGTITRAAFVDLVGGGPTFSLDNGYYQLLLAGLARSTGFAGTG